MYDEDGVLDALITIIKEESDFSDKNITKGDPSILDRGHDKCIIVNSGEIDTLDDDSEAAMFYRLVRYQPVIQLFRKYTRDQETRNALRDDTQAILARIAGHPTMNGNAESCYPLSAGEPTYLKRIDGAGSPYMLRTIVIEVRSLEALTLYE